MTAAVTIFAQSVVTNQERRLLTERANEVNLVLTNSLSTVSMNLALLRAGYEDGGAAGFTQDATAQLATSTTPRGYAVLRPSGNGFEVVTAAGQGLQAGQLVTGALAAAATAAQTTPKITTTGVYHAGNTRAIGFALRTGNGLVIVQQSLLGPVSAPAAAKTRPFSELRVVLYASTRPSPDQVLVATTKSLPLRGSVKYVPLAVGTSQWVTAVNAVHPLVGSVAASVPWVALGVGVVGSVLVFLLLEGMARRRDDAVEALGREHRFAESLQLRLLPVVPSVPGLDIASTYVPGGDDQQVGGDWFDVFELPSGQVAVVIGDVMGHDVEAAAIMSQVRASLRSYAVEGGDPALTIERLGDFVDLFGIQAVVTVVYGVLDPPAPDGSRKFAWANAGHLPPLVRFADGRVDELDQGSSPLLGAPSERSRPSGVSALPLGATLLLYTDGLVEVQGENLGAMIDNLRDVLSQSDTTTAEDVCASVLSSQLPSTRRDDVALLVVKVEAVQGDRHDDERQAASARGGT